jgi:lipoprotein-anchoring transpeptidase ErfK/SrfK
VLAPPLTLLTAAARGAALAAFTLLTVAACGRERQPGSRPDDVVAPSAPAAPPAPLPPPPKPTPLAKEEMHLVVDVDARKVHVWRHGKRVATHAVAVGTAQWPTRRGEWQLVQVIWNPEWNPPRESWARTRQARRPGDPANPLGRVQLVYDPPRSIHGTNQPWTIGTAASHGSIRVTNAVGVKLGRQVMEATGATRSHAWYARVQAERGTKVIVDLPHPVPITVR